MSLLTLILTRRMDHQQYEDRYEPPFDKLRTPRREYPPIVVVSPGGIQQLPPLSSPPSAYPTRLPATSEWGRLGRPRRIAS